MGFYIETDGNKDKAKWLMENHAAVLVTQSQAAEAVNTQGVVCVVDNGPFEAAAYAFSDNEFTHFTMPSDHRPKQYLIMDKAKAEELSGYKERQST